MIKHHIPFLQSTVQCLYLSFAFVTNSLHIYSDLMTLDGFKSRCWRECTLAAAALSPPWSSALHQYRVANSPVTSHQVSWASLVVELSRLVSYSMSYVWYMARSFLIFVPPLSAPYEPHTSASLSQNTCRRHSLSASRSCIGYQISRQSPLAAMARRK